MDVIYGLIPGMLILGLVGVAVFFWAARSGQFEDLEGEANRILMDDDLSQRKSRRDGGDGASGQRDGAETVSPGEGESDGAGKESDDGAEASDLPHDGKTP